MLVEVVDINDNFLGIVQGLECDGLSRVSGLIYNDSNENCQQDVGEVGLPNCTVKFTRNGLSNYINANEKGEYVYNCPAGDYAVNIILPENIFLLPCEPVVNLSLAANEQADLLFGSNTTGGSSTVSSVSDGKTSIGLSVTPNLLAVGQSLQITTNTAVDLQLYDTGGKLLRQWAQAISGEFAPNLRSGGIYFLKATAKDGDSQTIKLVVY